MRDPLKCTKVKEEVAVDEQIKTFEVTEKQVIVHSRAPTEPTPVYLPNTSPQ